MEELDAEGLRDHLVQRGIDEVEANILMAPELHQEDLMHPQDLSNEDLLQYPEFYQEHENVIHGERNGAETLLKGEQPGPAHPANVPSAAVDLQKAAELAVLKLRSVNYMTNTAIQETQRLCVGLVQETALQLKRQVQSFLNEGDQSVDRIESLLGHFNISDPFKFLKTKAQQLKIFKEKYGLLEAREINLGPRIEPRQDPSRPTRQVPTQVNHSFQYVSIIDILASVMSDPYLRNLILSDRKSEDGTFRSFCDGSEYESLPEDLKDAIRIVIYIDDLELLQALSAKAGRYKMAGMYFGIQNLPAELNALLTNIFATALAFAEDAKCSAVWEPFIRDMKRLETEGFQIEINGELVTFKAVLIAQIGDSKAAHETLGFVSPSANVFCRICYIKRSEMWEDGTRVGELRSPERHKQDVQCSNNAVLRKLTGVEGPPLLDGLRFFRPVHHSIFDLYHDLQQGVCKMEVKLALREYVCKKKYFTEEVMKSRIQFFEYGLPDVKNKPNPKMTVSYLNNVKSYNLHQTGSQMWCLTRAFGFLFGDLVPAEDNFLKLISLLNQIMTILFSHSSTPAASNDTAEEDEDDPEHEVTLCPEDVFEDVDDDIAIVRVENELDEDIPPVEGTSGSLLKKKSPKVIRMINKHHHMIHYCDMIRKMGNLVLYWCPRYEAKHYFFKLAATVTHNFKNILKTLMEMLQMKTAADKQEPVVSLEIGKRGTELYFVGEAPHSELLIAFGLPATAKVFKVLHVESKGISYRPDLFATLKPQTTTSFPVFGIIKAVYVSCNEEKVYLVTKEWSTQRFESIVCAFQVSPLENGPLKIYLSSEFSSYRLLAPWRKYNSDNIYLAPRTIT
ncbi:Laminin subunit alpha-2 [Frankliniella fusca]|uniref:Laminin subunit alpha-2 n=1 Tax=Frankliniella fusca TaxID=407009 RepID=A0AAE1HES5_9NEOP|nr:Laminin subunit alpha-2 [Frankliniella fusca]